MERLLIDNHRQQQQQEQSHQHHQQEPIPSSPVHAIPLSSSFSSSSSSSSSAVSTPSSPPVLTTTSTTTIAIEVGQACGPCTALKMRCSGETPCVRCWRLCLPCVPRLAAARKPKGRINKSKGISEGHSSSSTSTNSRRSHRLRDKAKNEDVPFQDSRIAAGGVTITSTAMEPCHHLDLLSELRFHRQDPRVYADLYLQVFHKIHHQGKICREKALNALRMWQVLSSVAEVDVTCGLAKGVAEMLQIIPIELEGPQMLGLESTPRHRDATARMAFAQIQQQCNTFKETERFRAACERRGGGVLMVKVDEHKILRACNTAFDKLFVSGTDPYDDIMRHKMLEGFMQASGVCPEDRHIIALLYLEILFARDVLPSQVFFLKAFGNDGKIRLLVVNVQRSSRANEEQMAMYIEEAPPSRHITPTPRRAPGSVAHTFRQSTFQERMAVSLGGADVEAGGRPDAGAGSGGAPTTAARASLMCTAFPFTPPPHACQPLKPRELEASGAGIFDLPASKASKETVPPAASGLSLLAAVASLDDAAIG